MESGGKKEANMPKGDRKWKKTIRKGEITEERALLQIFKAAEIEAGTIIQEIQSRGSKLDSWHKVDIQVREQDAPARST